MNLVKKVVIYINNFDYQALNIPKVYGNRIIFLQGLIKWRKREMNKNELSIKKPNLLYTKFIKGLIFPNADIFALPFLNRFQLWPSEFS